MTLSSSNMQNYNSLEVKNQNISLTIKKNLNNIFYIKILTKFYKLLTIKLCH